MFGKLEGYIRKMNLVHLLTPHTRINSKWTKDLNVRPKIIKILDESIGSKMSEITHSNIFSNISPQARETIDNINKLDNIKLKIFA